MTTTTAGRIEKAYQLAADVATLVVLPARGGLARVASRAVDQALDVASALAGSAPDVRVRENLTGLMTSIEVLKRLGALEELDAMRLMAQCESLWIFTTVGPVMEPAGTREQMGEFATDCGPLWLPDDEDE